MAEQHGLTDRTDAAKLLWALKESIGRRGWKLALLSRAGGYRASQSVQWLARINSLHHLSDVIFTEDRTSRGQGEPWPGGRRTFWYTTFPSHKREALVCGWYKGGKDDYVAGYCKAFPSHSVIMVDDGRDILEASRNQVQHLRTIRLVPGGWGPAEWPGMHVYATDLYDLAYRIRSMA